MPVGSRRAVVEQLETAAAGPLHQVHAGVEADGGHRAAVVVQHLDGTVPLAANTIHQHPVHKRHAAISTFIDHLHAIQKVHHVHARS